IRVELFFGGIRADAEHTVLGVERDVDVRRHVVADERRQADAQVHVIAVAQLARDAGYDSFTFIHTWVEKQGQRSKVKGQVKGQVKRSKVEGRRFSVKVEGQVKVRRA